jgi:hypothetical protein
VRPKRKRDPDGTEYVFSPSANRYIAVEGGTTRTAAHTKNWQSEFVQVPWTWVERLATSRSANTYRLALYLLDEHRRKRGEPIQVSNIGALNGAAIGRQAKWRALRELEALTLIQLERRRGQSPLVKLKV